MHESMHRTLLTGYLLILPLTVPPQSPKHNRNISSQWSQRAEGHECTLKDDLGGPVFVTESHPSIIKCCPPRQCWCLVTGGHALVST